MEKIQLLFKNPTFKEGINLTTRKGIKWATLTDFSKIIPIAETGKEDIILGHAHIKDVKVISFYDIHNEMLVDEHDPSCRTWYGLMNEMKKVYPTFIEDEIVTLLYFEFVKI